MRHILDYEKKLHLDEAWEKMQNRNRGTDVIRLVVDVVLYVILFLLLKWLLLYFPDMNPWDSSSVWFSLWKLSFKQIDIVYFICGLAIYVYGSVRFIGINRQNHSVRVDNNTTSELLANGYYAKLRHPMYGVFILRAFAVFLSVRSLIGIVLAVIFAALQYINALREEEKELIPLFGIQYNEYMLSVKSLLLNIWEAFALFVWLLVDVLGLLYR